MENINNDNEIINGLIQESTKHLVIPISLKDEINTIKELTKIDQLRLATEALLVGIRHIREKYSVPENPSSKVA